jgi:titin
MSYASRLLAIVALCLPGIAAGQWTQTNCPAAGNVLSFAASGSTLLAGINGGYVYYTADNGATWTQITTGMPANASVTALVSSNYGILAGTYGSGVYVLASDASGWSAVSTGLPANATINAFLASGSQLFAGTSGNGVYLYSTGTSGWVASNSGLPGNLTVNAFAVGGGSIFVATSGGIYKSTNSGSTWTPANSGIPGTSAAVNTVVANGTSLYAGTNGNGVYYSVDNGATWNAFNSGLSNNTTILSLAANGYDVFAGTAGGVFHNPGSGWAAVNTGLTSITTTLPLAVIGTTLFAGTGSGVWKSVMPPLAPSSFVPANFATNQPDSLTFSWNSLASATVYAFQISTDSTFASTTYNAGGLITNSQTVKGLTNNTTYYWRVDASNVGGTSAWCAPNRFATTLLAPTAALPADKSTNQPTSLSLSWNAVASATSYALQVGTDSTFATSVIFSQTNLAATAQTVTGLSNNTLYYWHVSATNAGGTSAWSAVCRFTTIVAVPSQPILGLPANAAVGQPVSFSLSWNSATSASSYSLQVSTDSTFANSVVYSQNNLTATSQSVTGLTNSTTYYWRVNATNMAGTGAWSAVDRFSTILGTPTSLLPATASINQQTTLTLSWSAVTAATSYALQVATDSNFNNLFLSQGGLTAASQAVSGLSNNTTYYWRVNSTNAGGTGGWSVKNSFATIVATPSSPTLVLPLNQAANQPVSLTLAWTAVSPVTSYSLQISTDSTFATATIFSQTGLTSTSQVVNGLSNNTKYFWRVNAINAAGTGAWSSVSCFTTVIAAPTLVSPATGATAQPLSLTFQWNAVATATNYTLQVATDSNFTSAGLFYNQNGLQTTSQVVGTLANNTAYYWRVNAANTGGTSVWSSVYKLTTVLAGPTLVSPTNNATNQPVSLTLSWGAVTTGASYTLQVSTDSTFSSSLAFNQNGLTTTSQTVSGLANNTAYYWRVCATNTGGTSVWSSYNSFTTTLIAPTLIAPATGAVSQMTTLVLSWSAVASATSYALQVSTDPAFATSSYNQCGLTATSQTVTGLASSTTYYWRVNATNPGGTSTWATKSNFTTAIASPALPVLISPTNGASSQAVTVVMSWNAVTGATSYTLQVSSDSTFASPSIYYQSGLVYAAQTVTGLSNNTNYYWHVSATNAGGTSDWSATYRFATIQLTPSTPTLTFPANGATNQPSGISFSWNSVVGATSYSLQVSTDPNFVTSNYYQGGLLATSQTVTGLAANTVYYWRANATNAGGTSAWSVKADFTTAVSVSGIPNLVSPANNATSEPVSLTVSWSAVSSASSYSLQVSTDSTFGTTFTINQSGLTATSQAISGLTNNMVYYWRVNATNSAGISAWSLVSHFSTILPAPVLENPGNSATGLALTVLLQWDSVATARSYGVMVAADSSFKTTIFNQTGLTATSQSVSYLNSNTQYYWCVNATNASGTSAWSTKRYFTTLIGAPVPSTPANNAINQSVSVKVGWSTVTSATSYSLQMSTDSLFASSLVYAQSGLTAVTQSVAGLINNTQYYWRVSATNAAGTSAWSTASRFTTTMAAPTLVSPASGAANQPVALAVAWNAVPAAAGYYLQVSSDSSFSTAPSFVFNQSGLTSTSQAVNGMANNRTYFWRVEATSASGGISDWSARSSFTTVFSAPVAVSPVSGASNQPVSIKLSWSAAATMTSFTLQVSVDSTFLTGVVYSQSGITASSQTVSGLANAVTYYWRVNGVNANGGMSAWSAVSRFSTTNSAPTPIAPVTSVSQTVTFAWDSVPGSTSYSLQVSGDSTFAGNMIYNQSNIAAISQVVSNLASATVYFWRVNATNSTNGTGAWSVTSRFTTISAAPVPIAPVNNASNMAVTDTLSWNAVAQASAYSVQVSADSTFMNPQMFTLSKTSQIVTGLVNNTSYFWRVNATDAGGTSVWSSKYRFVTIIAAPLAPKLGATAGDSGHSAITLILSWDSVATATSYTLQVATDSAFAKLLYNQAGIVGTSQTVTGLSGNATYYWRVSATNIGGTGAWSSVNFFKTQATAVLNSLKSRIPTVYALENARYNPATAVLTVKFAVPPALQTPHVRIEVYDVLGRHIATAVDGLVAAGYHSVDCRLGDGRDFSLGAASYICTMDAPGYKTSHMVPILKR